MVWEHEPHVRARHGAVLRSPLNIQFGKDQNGDLALEIDTSDRGVRRCEEQSGKTLDGDANITVLVGCLHSVQVRQHLELNACRLDSYESARTRSSTSPLPAAPGHSISQVTTLCRSVLSRARARARAPRARPNQRQKGKERQSATILRLLGTGGMSATNSGRTSRLARWTRRASPRFQEPRRSPRVQRLWDQPAVWSTAKVPSRHILSVPWRSPTPRASQELQSARCTR